MSDLLDSRGYTTSTRRFASANTASNPSRRLDDQLVNADLVKVNSSARPGAAQQPRNSPTTLRDGQRQCDQVRGHTAVFENDAVQPLADLLEGFGVPAAGSIVLGGGFRRRLRLRSSVGRRSACPSSTLARVARPRYPRSATAEEAVRIGIVFVAISVASGWRIGNFLQSLATIAAAATLAIGFAMQDVIANFVAGIFIFTDKPFRINDWIEWDGNSGIVEDISFRVTRVRTFDNELLTVPNSQLTDGVIKNPVAKDKLRLQVPFGIGYDDDIQQATDIILDEAEAHDGIMTTPEPSVRLTELGDSSVGLQSRIWIKNPSRSTSSRRAPNTSSRSAASTPRTSTAVPEPAIGGGLEMTGFDGVVEPADD